MARPTDEEINAARRVLAPLASDAGKDVRAALDTLLRASVMPKVLTHTEAAKTLNVLPPNVNKVVGLPEPLFRAGPVRAVSGQQPAFYEADVVEALAAERRRDGRQKPSLD